MKLQLKLTRFAALQRNAPPQTAIFWLYKPLCDLDPEDSNLVCLHGTPAYDDVWPYQVRLQKL